MPLRTRCRPSHLAEGADGLRPDQDRNLSPMTSTDPVPAGTDYPFGAPARSARDQWRVLANCHRRYRPLLCRRTDALFIRGSIETKTETATHPPSGQPGLKAPDLLGCIERPWRFELQTYALQVLPMHGSPEPFKTPVFLASGRGRMPGNDDELRPQMRPEGSPRASLFADVVVSRALAIFPLATILYLCCITSDNRRSVG
jgi:hypothetical protein